MSPRLQKRRNATLLETLRAVTDNSVDSLLIKRTVSAAVAQDAMNQLRKMYPQIDADPRALPLLEHLRREVARGAPTKRARATREIGDVIDYHSQRRDGGVSAFGVVPLSTLGNPDEYTVAFGADRIVIGRRGEVTAADVGIAPARSADEILAELKKATGGT